MTTSLPERVIPAWTRSISPRQSGLMILILALLLTLISYIFQSQLNYPAILLDQVSLTNSFPAQGEVAVLLSFVGLLLCGLLLFVVSLGLLPHVEKKRQGRVIISGGASAIF